MKRKLNLSEREMLCRLKNGDQFVTEESDGSDNILEKISDMGASGTCDIKMVGGQFPGQPLCCLGNSLVWPISKPAVSTKANPVPQIRLVSADGMGGGLHHVKVTDSDLENWYQDPRA